MTPIDWPDGLPCFRWEPYQVAPRPGSLEETLGMITNLSRVYTQNNEVVSCELVLNATQEPIFRTFYKTTLSMGTQWFNAEIWRNSQLEMTELLFYGAPPVFTPIAQNVVRASFTLLTRGEALPEPAPFACEVPVTGTYMVSPAWASYPTGIASNTTASAPFLIDEITGRITFATNKYEEGAGESPLPPLTMTASMATTTYEHIGTLVSSGTIDVDIQAPGSGVWGGGTLRKFIIEVTPIQFSEGLFLARRQGYAGAAFSTFFTSGLATADGGYIGDFESYSPAGYGGSRGGAFEVARAKYFNGNVYAQLGTTPANLTTTLLTFSAPGGNAPASLGPSYSGEELYDDPVARTFSQVIRDVACDPGTGYIYVMYRTGSGPYTITVERINPTTLATIDSWAHAFVEIVDGFSINGSRVVLAGAASGLGARYYFVMDLNGTGGMDTVHTGHDEVDPSTNLAGTYVWADPLCGFLKQKNRWLSGAIGP